MRMVEKGRSKTAKKAFRRQCNAILTRVKRKTQIEDRGREKLDWAESIST